MDDRLRGLLSDRRNAVGMTAWNVLSAKVFDAIGTGFIVLDPSAPAAYLRRAEPAGTPAPFMERLQDESTIEMTFKAVDEVAAPILVDISAVHDLADHTTVDVAAALRGAGAAGVIVAAGSAPSEEVLERLSGMDGGFVVVVCLLRRPATTPGGAADARVLPWYRHADALRVPLGDLALEDEAPAPLLRYFDVGPEHHDDHPAGPVRGPVQAAGFCALAHAELERVLTEVRAQGAVAVARPLMLPFDRVLELVGFDRFDSGGAHGGA